MVTQEGYEACFVEKVGEDFKCILCHLVLRNPVQIMSCGHRFCANCFQRFVEYKEQSNVQLECPIDRKHVKPEEVRLSEPHSDEFIRY